MFVRLLTQYKLISFFLTDNFLSCTYFGCQCAGIETKCTRLRTESRGYTPEKSNSLVSFGSVKHYAQQGSAHFFMAQVHFWGKPQ